MNIGHHVQDFHGIPACGYTFARSNGSFRIRVPVRS